MTKAEKICPICWSVNPNAGIICRAVTEMLTRSTYVTTLIKKRDPRTMLILRRRDVERTSIDTPTTRASPITDRVPHYRDSPASPLLDSRFPSGAFLDFLTVHPVISKIASRSAIHGGGVTHFRIVLVIVFSVLLLGALFLLFSRELTGVDF